MQVSVHLDISPKAVSVGVEGLDPEATVDVGVTAKESADKTPPEEKASS